MPTLVIALRLVALLVFAGAMLLGAIWRRGQARTQASSHGGARAPLAANLAAFGLFLLSLLLSSGGTTGTAAVPLALSGSLVALAGVGLVVRSRAELSAAWSLVPQADRSTGLVTTGPYGIVRHPIYLGLALLALGEAVAFASLPALAVALLGVIPSLAWRACAEEKLLGRIFGVAYEDYRQRTRMIVPGLL